MSNDERREKRVQASLRVRYKSATVTEFIEKHSHDISPGGVFIRSQKPLARGSLLKIDFRLEDDTAVIQGVGRVVWTREDSREGKPAGMGIKFIRLDEDSEQNIHKIISMQKAGKEITRESVFGGDEVEGDDTAIPSGDDLRDSITPSVEDMETNDDFDGNSEQYDANPEPAADESLAEDGEQAEDDPNETEQQKSGPADESEGRKNGIPDRPSTAPAATVFPAEEEKHGHWGIIIAVAVVVAGALAFFMMRSPRNNDRIEEDNTPEALPAATDDASTVTSDRGAATDAPEPKPAAVVPVDTDTVEAGTETDSINGDTASAVSDGTDSGMDTEADTSATADTEATGNPTADANVAPAVPSGATEVIVTCNQKDAAISIDGVAQTGKMPYTLANLSPGDHEFKAELFGFRPYNKTFTIVAGEPNEVKLKMIRAKVVTTWKANVLGATVFVDGKKIGNTPMRLSRRFEESFEYRFAKNKFEDVSGTITSKDWEYKDGFFNVILDVAMNPVPEPDAEGAAAATSAN